MTFGGRKLKIDKTAAFKKKGWILPKILVVFGLIKKLLGHWMENYIQSM